MRVAVVGVIALGLLMPLAHAALAGATPPAAQVAAPTLIPLSSPPAPSAPTHASAVPSSTGTGVSVSWTPGPGTPSTAFTVAAFTSTGAIAGSATCTAPCTSMVVPGLTPGGRYSFAIWPSNAAGGGPAAATPWVTVNRGCVSAAFCVSVDATAATGPITHVASGLLHSTYVPRATVAPVAPKSWRVEINPTSTGYDYSSYDAARRDGAAVVSVIVGDSWFWESNGACGIPSPTCGATPPWLNLPAYTAWITAYVRAIEATGRRPDYWDLANEPDGTAQAGIYYTAANAATVTPANLMAMFAAAFHAVKAADPAAKVMGPSLSSLSPTLKPRLDMTTFLDSSVALGLRWDAISWHENGDYKPAAAWGWVPTETIPADVATVRSLLAARPSLGHAVLAINEFGNMYAEVLPGWYVAQMAALEASGVSVADRTCFYTTTDPGDVSGCDGDPSNLDELLLGTGQPTADYQVAVAYAALAGNTIRATTSDITWSALASIDASRTVRLLIGRAATCTAAVNSDCNLPAAWTPPPASVTISAAVPWAGSATLLVQRIPNTRGPVFGPVPLQSVVVPVTHGRVVTTVSGIADGDALIVTIRPH